MLQLAYGLSEGAGSRLEKGLREFDSGFVALHECVDVVIGAPRARRLHRFLNPYVQLWRAPV